MKIVNLIDEDFVQYKKPSMFIGIGTDCCGKCWKELGLPPETCQNELIRASTLVEIDVNDIILRYLNNPITKAIVLGGLEPFYYDRARDINGYKQVWDLIVTLRDKYKCDDDIVIYTGYEMHEVHPGWLNDLNGYYNHGDYNTGFDNIIFKFGRYRPDLPNVENNKDEVLGIALASTNQYGYKFS